jgi:predicted DNA-binding protein (MmcQ/YjbR family)
VSGQTVVVPIDGLDRDDEAVLAHVRRICLGFDGADEAELQDRPLFRVGRRRFALFNGVGSPPRRRWMDSGRSLHLIADPLEIGPLRHDRRFTVSPHHGDRGWIALRLDGPDLDWDEVAELLESAYRQVDRRRDRRGRSDHGTTGVRGTGPAS